MAYYYSVSSGICRHLEQNPTCIEIPGTQWKCNEQMTDNEIAERVKIIESKVTESLEELKKFIEKSNKK